MGFTANIGRIIVVAILATGMSLVAAPTAAEAAKTAARENGKKGAATAGELQKLVEQVSAQREKMISDHDALARELKQATDEQRKKILAQMHEQKKAFEAAQGALHKQIRDEQRRMRQNVGRR